MNKKKISQLPLAGTLTGTELIEVVQGGVNKKTTVADLGGGSVGYNEYVAILNQTGASAPVATEIVNTLSGTPVYSRQSGGYYLMTLNNAFLLGKTITLLTNGSNGISLLPAVLFYRLNDNQLVIESAVTDGGISNASLIIRVYP